MKGACGFQGCRWDLLFGYTRLRPALSYGVEFCQGKLSDNESKPVAETKFPVRKLKRIGWFLPQCSGRELYQ